MFKTNIPIQFLVIIPENNAAYPLVDAYGKELGIIQGEGQFDVVYWNLIIIDTLPCEKNGICNKDLSLNTLEDAEILINIVAHPEIIVPIAALMGDICMKVKTNLGVVSVKIATKMGLQNPERIPVTELAALAEILHGANRIQAHAPCFENIPIIEPPPPFTVSAPPPLTTPCTAQELTCNNSIHPCVVVQLLDLQFQIASNPQYYVFMLGGIPFTELNELYWRVTDAVSGYVGNSIWLKRLTIGSLGKPVYRSTYQIHVQLRLVYPQGLPSQSYTPAFWLASQSGAYFNNYNVQCCSDPTDNCMPVASGCDDKTYLEYDVPNNSQRTVVTIDRTISFDTTCGNFFMIGIYPGINGVNIELDPTFCNRITFTFISDGPCGLITPGICSDSCSTGTNK